jgi:hypothetical protein
VDGALYDAIRAILLLGMAFLAWREFRRIRADVAERKRRERDDPPQD